MKIEETGEIFKFLGLDIEAIESADKAKDLISGVYIKRNEVANDDVIKAQIMGSRLGAIETEVKRSFKELGVEIGEDLKGKKIEELIQFGSSKFKSQLEELKAAAPKGDGKINEELKTKFDLQSRELNDFKQLNESLKAANELIVSEHKAKERSSIITAYKQESIKGVKLRTDIDEMTLIGFHSILDKKYAVNVDDDNKPFVIDLATKARIQSKKGAGSFAEFSEIFEMEAESRKLTSTSPHAGKPAAGANPAAPPIPGMPPKVLPLMSERARLQQGIV